MKPPICRICDRDFDPTEEGGAVSFEPGRDPWWKGRVDAEEVERSGPPTGHPPHVAWFCGEHLKAAEALSHLQKGKALDRMEVEEEDS